MSQFSHRMIPGVFLLLAATLAQAGAFHHDGHYLARYRFPGTLNGKRVKTVYVHTGVLMVPSVVRGGANFWGDVKHQEMRPVGDHFIGTAVLEAKSASDDVYAHGVEAQYWVYFEDGSQTVTDSTFLDPYSVAVFSSVRGDDPVRGQAFLQNEIEKLNATKDVGESDAHTVLFSDVD